MVRTLLLLLTFLAATAPNVRADVTAFIYHRVGDGRYPSTNVDAERFREQMAYLKANKYQVLPLAEVVDALKEGKPLPERAVVITFDDGYRSVYKKAWPILKSFGYPFTVFLYTEATDRGWPDHMSWDQVREMRGAGVDFQDHGYAHLRMGTKPAGLDEEANRSRIRSDLLKSARLITENLGELPIFLALPYGEYNRTVVEETRKLGYQAVFTQDPGAISAETDPFLIPREPILGQEWSAMGHFATVLQRVDLPFAGMQPDIVPLPAAAPERFAVRLLHPERYRPDSLGLYVTELGWQKATLAGDVLSVPNKQPLTKRANRVAVSGREKEGGRTAIRFWQLFKE